MKSSMIKYLAPLFISLLTFTPVFAIEDQIKTQASIDSSVLQLGTVKDNDTLSPEDKLSQQVDARINVIGDVISLSIKELSGLRDKLNQLPEFDKESTEKRMQDDFLVKLDEYELRYNDYSNQLSVLKDDTSDLNKLDENLKDLAKQIKDYRDDTYNADAQKISNFVLLFYADTAISTTKTRLNKIKNDISKLEGFGLISKGYFKSSIDKASKLIVSAGDSRSQASDLIIVSLDENIPAKVNKIKLTPKELIENALGNVKSSYDIFLKISKDVRKTLKTDL